MVINNRNIGSVSNNAAASIHRRPVQPDGRFDSILQEKISRNQGLKFSKHAEQRLQMRNINLDKSQMEKINEAVTRAETKGVRDSLVIMGNMAFVVNVRNRTVITAVDSSELKGNIFTNIDGAVFA